VDWDVTTGRNVRWKTPIPGLATSSPIVWGNRVFVATAVSTAGENTFRTGIYGDTVPVNDLSEHTWKLYALDSQSGRIVWERDVHKGIPRTKRHPKGSQASSTPVTDGRRIVVLFGSVGVLATYDMNGRLLWKKDLGLIDSGWFFDATHQWGHSSSPIIYQDSVILQVDRQKDSYIAAYDLGSGKETWRTNRSDEIPTWGTPAIAKGKLGDELITNGTKVRGYDPETGKLRWTLAPNSEITIATPVVGSGLVYVTGGYPPARPIYAIRPGFSGDISLAKGATSNEAIAWSNDREGTYIPTPIVYRGLLYTLNINGILTAYDAQTGERVYRARVGNGGAFSASPVAADGRLYFASEDGEVFVAKAGREYIELAKHEMQEPIMATPAISNGLIIIRTMKNVYGIGSK
jgi:outer membrane protein assembly factor BamB